MKNFRNLNDELTDFNGSETVYRHRSQMHFTKGVHLVREKFKCYWLIDLIFYNDMELNTLHEQEFYVFILERIIENDQRTNKFTLRIEDGNYNVLGSQDIPFSDFEADKVTFWFENNTLYLPSEH